MDELLQEFDFNIEYIEGNKNVVVDALCRQANDIPNVISFLKSSLMDEIELIM